MKLRPNIMMIAGFVFLKCAALIFLIIVESDREFLMGALVGLIGTGLTALMSLGNNILE